MSIDQITARQIFESDEALAAELADAAYSVALQHGAGENWLQLELDLWRVMNETIKRMQRTNLGGVSKPQENRGTSQFFG